MTSSQRHSFALLVVTLFASFLVVACSEKNAQAPSPSSEKPAKDAAGGDDKADDTGEDDTEDAGEEAGDDTAEGGEEAFDLCTGLEDKKGDIDGFSSYIEELCSGENKLTTLRESKNIFKGGSPLLLKKTTESGETTSVRLFTSTVVSAKAEDYFAMVKLQVSKPKEFSENFEHDKNVNMTEVQATSKQSSFHYQYSDPVNEGNVEYKATARFHTIKKGVAFVSATKLDESLETMKDLKGLIIVSDKGGGKAEVFTMSDQTYEVAADQDPKLYDQEATKKAGAEQKRMYQNAKDADKAPDLLK